MKKILFVGLFFVLICGGLNAAQKKGHSASVEAMKVLLKNTGYSLEVGGDIRALNKLKIKPLQDGRIIYCPWREGDSFKKGEKLIEIEREAYINHAKAAEAAVKAQKNSLDSAGAARWPAFSAQGSYKYDWQDDITGSPGVPKVEIGIGVSFPLFNWGGFNARVSREEALLEQKKYEYEYAKSILDECVINAPFDGVVTKVFVKKGDVAGTRPFTPLLEIMDVKSIVVRFDVPEAYAFSVSKGDAVRIKINKAGKTVYENAIVDSVYPELDNSTHTRTMEARLDKSGTLIPGMYVGVLLNVGNRKSDIVIPERAVLTSPKGGSYVFVVQNSKAVKKQIDAEYSAGNVYRVKKGLKPGDVVVTEGNQKLKDGQQVKVVNNAGGGE